MNRLFERLRLLVPTLRASETLTESHTRILAILHVLNAITLSSAGIVYSLRFKGSKIVILIIKCKIYRKFLCDYFRAMSQKFRLAAAPYSIVSVRKLHPF